MTTEKANNPEKDIALAQMNHALTKWLQKKEEKAQVVADFDKQIKELYMDLLEAHDRANSPQMNLLNVKGV